MIYENWKKELLEQEYDNDDKMMEAKLKIAHLVHEGY
jgi:hypothetical protein